MAFKQPRVPEYREREGADKYIRSLVLFLKDFCMDVWTANLQRSGEIDAVKGDLSNVKSPVTSVNQKTGAVVLSAADVGARSSSWMPTAAQVGALAVGGTAANASKLGGKTLAEVMLAIYPVGAVYISLSAASPASLFGGAWEQLQGRFLLGQSGTYPAGSTGGEARHTLTLSEMPSHNHGATQWVTGWSDWPRGTVDGYYFSYDRYNNGNGASAVNTPRIKNGNLTIEAAGGGAAHNTMPPYLAVHMWKRVS